MSGFYVPGTVSQSFVSNKRDEAGVPIYEGQLNQIGLQKQAAMQQLNEDYSQTIDNAYSAYLNANRGINASNMGQGYKEAYKQLQEQQMMNNVANASINLEEQRANLNAQELNAAQQIQQAYQTEVGYFDKLQQSLSDYYDYAKSLSYYDEKTEQTLNYFTDEELKYDINSMYDLLFELQPQGYTDANGEQGKSFMQWVGSQLKDDDYNRAWYQWLLSTGYNEFKQAPKAQAQLLTREAKKRADEEAAKKAKEEAEKKAKEEKDKKPKSHRSSSSGSHGYDKARDGIKHN